MILRPRSTLLALTTAIAALASAACGARAVAPLDGFSLPDVPVAPDAGDGSTPCPTGFTLCNGVCRNISADPLACGGCGIVCSDSGRCQNGVCLPGGCPPGQTPCGARCFDLASDPNNCGACFNACPMPLVCQFGTCVGDMPCPPPLTLCNGACVGLDNDPENCGGCNVHCAANEACAIGACVLVTPPVLTGPTFRVSALGATGCSVIEHAMVTGDDRGGIAMDRGMVLYTGDSATGLFVASSLAPVRSVTPHYDGLVGNLGGATPASAVAYVLTEGGILVDGGPRTATDLLEIDAMGSLTTTRVHLSTPIPLPGGTMGSGVGIFSGRDRAVILTGTRAFHVALPSGAVTDMGAMATPMHSFCESFAFYGVAEFFGGALYVDYVRDGNSIVRTRVPDGSTTVLASFRNLSDMCSFTVDPPSRRWYFHHEGMSQFRSGDETLGFCDGTFSDM